MQVRPHRIIRRKKTRVIKVGKVSVGGESPISVQSMTNTLTTDIKSTIKQIHLLEAAGADIVRVSCPDEGSTKSLKKIIKEVNVPIVADIHFHYKRAIEAAEMGASCIRINPGNIGSYERVQEHRQVVESYDLPSSVPTAVTDEDLMFAMTRDKKAVDGYTFILDGPKGPEIVKGVEEVAIQEALRKVR